MYHEQTICGSQQIERFLAEQLSDEEQHALENHLGACHACRKELEKQAAEADLWREARELLGAGPLGPCFDELFEESTPSDAILTGDGENIDLDLVLSALAPTDDPQRLGRLGGYEIAGVIGQGGMGVVLKGYDAALNRYVALKVLAPHLAASGAARRRFAREAQAAAAVMHENVVAIHSVDEANHLPYFVMPYLRGASLQKRLSEHGPLGVVEVLRIAMQTAEGLAAAHAQGLVHRDIKPANILLTNGVERVKITDFGLARAVDDASLTRTGAIAGTPQYMSPEQARGESVDARSDLFSLGSVMYAMCTGRPPFRAETSYGVLRRITDGRPRPIREIGPDIPVWLEAIIEKLHAKDPGERFQSAAAVARLLQQCLAHVQQSTVTPLPKAAADLARQTSRASTNRRRRKKTFRRVFVAGTFAGVCLILGIAVGVAIRDAPSDESGKKSVQSPASTADKSSANIEDDQQIAADTDNSWSDDIATQILRLQDEADELEEHANQMWDDEPAPLPARNRSMNKQPFQQESLK